jgi:hypothetical protein
MPYDDAFKKAYDELNTTAKQEKYTVKFLADNYEVYLTEKKVLSVSCNAVAPEHLAILILHYLIAKLKGLPRVRDEWISFNDLAGGKGYFAAFRKRAIEPIMRKYAKFPQDLVSCLERLPGKKIQYGDCALVLEVFEAVPVMVALWGQDEEFSAEANMLFDRSIIEVFSTEDVAVLAGIVAKEL